MTDFSHLSIHETITCLKRKDFSVSELIDFHVSSMENGRELNAFITETADIAREKAIDSDNRYLKGEENLLDGIPIGIKDMFCTKGIKTTASSKMLENFIPPYESTVTQNLWNDGAILLGKLNNDELYAVLAYGKKTKDKKIKEAAEIIRRDILGEKLVDEVSLNKNNLMKQIKEGRSTLEESEKALGQTENLTPSEVTRLNEKVNKVNSAFDTLKNFYNTKVEEIRKTYTTGAARLNPKDKYVIVATNKKGQQEILEELNLEAWIVSAKGKSSYKTPQEAFAEMNKTKKSTWYKEKGTDIYGRTLDVYKYQGNAKKTKFTNKNKITEESLTGKLDSKKFNEALSKLDRYFFERGKRGAVFTSKNKKNEIRKRYRLR